MNDIETKYNRIIVKAGTSLLTGGSGQLHLTILENLVSQIAELQRSGHQIVLVSSGAVAVGRSAVDSVLENKDVLDRQVLAAVGQPRLMNIYEQLFTNQGIVCAQALLSRRDFDDRLGYLNLRNTLWSLMDRGMVPIINENDVVAVEELEGNVFGDNDSLSAMVSNVIDADLLLMLGTVDGMFTKDPNLNRDAELISTVDHVDETVNEFGGPSSDRMGRGGMATKIEAAKLATSSGANVVIANGTVDSVIVRITNGERLGTLFVSGFSRLESRERWMVSGLLEGAHIKIDSGAAQALSFDNSSLLAAGIIDVKGNFERGDVVSILGNNNRRISIGISNYSSADLLRIRNLRSNAIEKTLGYHYGDAVVHRNNMVKLED